MSMLRAVVTKKSPFYIQFYVSARCNLRCRHCGIVHANETLPEATLDEIRQIADNLVKIGAGVVVLMGGEPFLRKDYPEIVKIFIERQLDVRLQTAGMKVATREMLKACVAAGARDINVSIDSLDAGKQDYINNCPKTWENAVRTMADISNIFPKNQAITSFGSVISAFNFHEIPAILELATRIGWFLSLVPVHINRQGEDMAYRGGDSEFLVKPKDYSELENVFSTLKQMRKEGYNLFDSSSYLDSALSFMKTGRPTWRKNEICDSPYLYFVIRPDGDFAVCADYQLKEMPVSVIDKDFPAIYRSKAFRQRIDQITRNCPGCQYGSYPEMSISTRSLLGMWERLKTTLKVRKNGIIPNTYESLINQINEVKAKYSSIYSTEWKQNRKAQ
jgi:MoaA/NifB/PqqE/SkfB family radical SAM enzyme